MHINKRNVKAIRCISRPTIIIVRPTNYWQYSSNYFHRVIKAVNALEVVSSFIAFPLL